ncbi:hypothetical protein P8S54_04125 [Thiomicrospira sp. R3]|uniref:hypothetical protein n=1 Tax=Thiomicrospira sp. R3 TaxID=3035472 RepID=UPI00259AF36F|nr:hypothetical protein [Thiomicrospira sp. R3]WFE69494.1 hypothetical protein P8S54_04125 [Thiomicrospira sp. R3]
MNKPVEHLITQHLDIWTQATEAKSTAGRGTRGKINLLGIQKLRELILEMAVRGLLVPQDPNDEPASELLKKIAAEKAQLIKDGKIKKSKPLPEITDNEKPFELPKGWEWVRLGEVTNYGEVQKAEPKDVSHNTWVLELEDVEKITSKLLQKNTFAEKPFKSSKNRFERGDVIYGKLRPYLDKVLVADDSGVCTTEMIPFRGYALIEAEYLRLVLKTPYFIEYANSSTHGMNLPRLGTDKAKLALFPLISKQEQARIVAKVDELMALCDALEAQTLDSMATHQTLVETLLASLVQSAPSRSHVPRGNADPAATTSTNTSTGSHAQHGNQTVGLRNNQAWLLIAQHFDALFTTEHSIDTLKQTILQLAVMGKLVPQDPNDEPASELLKKIAAEKAQLIKDGKLKKTKPLPPITDDEKPFDLPNGWEWVRLGDLSITKGGFAFKSTEFVQRSNFQVVRMGNVKPDSLLLDNSQVFIDENTANSANDYLINHNDT